MKPAHIERMETEQAELDERIEKLRDFIGTETFNALPLIDRELLNMQLSAMHTYAAVLGARLRRIEPFTESGSYAPSMMDEATGDWADRVG